MDINTIKEELLKINSYLSKCAWMDFSFHRISVAGIQLFGSIDLCYKDYESIKIEFVQPSHINGTLYEIHIDNSKPFIEVISKKEAKKIFGFDISEQEHVFKVNAEDDVPAWIIAESIECEILKPPHKV